MATNSTSVVTATWDDRGLQKIFEELHPDQQFKLHKNAMRVTARKIRDAAKKDAESFGLAKSANKENDGWKWKTFGRIPAALTVGKLWTRGDISGVRVFVKSRGSFFKSAPHANPVMVGYTQKIPTRSGQSVNSGEQKPARPVFSRAKSEAPRVFRKAVEDSVKRMVKRLNRKYGGTL